MKLFLWLSCRARSLLAEVRSAVIPWALVEAPMRARVLREAGQGETHRGPRPRAGPLAQRMIRCGRFGRPLAEADRWGPVDPAAPVGPRVRVAWAGRQFVECGRRRRRGGVVRRDARAAEVRQARSSMPVGYR